MILRLLALKDNSRLMLGRREFRVGTFREARLFSFKQSVHGERKRVLFPSFSSSLHSMNFSVVLERKAAARQERPRWDA